MRKGWGEGGGWELVAALTRGRGWECVGFTGSVLFADCITVIVAKVANIAYMYMYIHVIICLHLKFKCLLVHCMCNIHVQCTCIYTMYVLMFEYC